MKEKLRKAALMLSRGRQVLFKANLVSIPSARPAKATQTLFQKENNNKEFKTLHNLFLN